jgi:Zn-dependent peptidase ImmA (M78 family)
MNIGRAQREATKLLQSLNIRSAPVDVNAVAAAIGLKVVYEDFNDDISGLLITRDTTGVIGVHARHPVVRQRFTVAHEIGHFVMRHHAQSGEHVHIDEGWKVSARNERSAKGVDIYEIEANRFAAALLMPDNFVKAKVGAFRGKPLSEADVLQLAKEFKVSEQAMTLRLRNLQL